MPTKAFRPLRNGRRGNGRRRLEDGKESFYPDASGQRVRATVNSSPYDFIFQGGQAVDAVTASSWVWGNAGGLGVAAYANSTTYFGHSDWLGTLRAWSGVSGASVGTCTSLPFGDGQSCTGTMPLPLHYTDEPLDAESGLHHFLFRQLSTTQGRWATSDPAGLGAVSAADPQTWNRYAYVRSSPASRIDPVGTVDINPGISMYLEMGGGGMDCNMDGLTTPCGVVYAVLQGGGGVACPYKNCMIITADNRLAYFWASTNGPGRYYTYSGPGALYYTLQQAGLAAANYIAGVVHPSFQGDNHEYASNVYADSNGVFSFTQPEQSPECPSEADCSWSPDFGAVPDGTLLVGSAHSHPPGGYGDTSFSEINDIGTYLSFDPQLFGFLLTAPGNRVVMFNPIVYNQWWNTGGGSPVCVLQNPFPNDTASCP
jgi:RHS repeat-associated protein